MTHLACAAPFLSRSSLSLSLYIDAAAAGNDAIERADECHLRSSCEIDSGSENTDRGRPVEATPGLTNSPSSNKIANAKCQQLSNGNASKTRWTQSILLYYV